MGISDEHAGDVPLVLNPKTGCIAPQWNVIFDDSFSTITYNEKELPDFHSNEWSEMFGAHTCSLPHDEQDEEDFQPVKRPRQRRNWETEDDDMLSFEEFVKQNKETNDDVNTQTQEVQPIRRRTDAEPVKRLKFDTPHVESTTPISSPLKTPIRHLKTPIIKPDQTISEPKSSPNKLPQQKTTPMKSVETPISKVEKVTHADDTPVNVRQKHGHSRAGRPLKDRERLTHNTKGEQAAYVSNEFNEEPLVDDLTIEHIANQCQAYFASYGIDGEFKDDMTSEKLACLSKLDKLNPHQFAQVFKAAKGKNPDTLSYEEAMSDYKNLKDWLASSLKEIRQLEKKGVWTEVAKDEAKGEQIMPCTWVFCYKRNPAGEIIKCKARICLRGDLMEDDSDACAPVVEKSAIKGFAGMTVMLNWISMKVDWVNAFPQAKLKKPMHMHTPRGFTNKCGRNGCLKLGWNLCGSKFAPINWYKFVSDALLNKLGFKQCPHDPCMFHQPGILMTLCVDDAGMAAPCEKDTEDFAQELRDLVFDLEIEGDFTEHLGTSIDQEAD